MKYLILIFLATFVLFSCGGSSEPAAEMTTEPVEVEAPAPPPETVEVPSMLTATLNAVKSVGGDITALPAKAAVANIEGWMTKLESMDGTDAIVANLNSLKTELSSGDIDGSAVSEILSKLAIQTKELAGNSTELQAVAGALDAGAKKLSGM